MLYYDYLIQYNEQGMEPAGDGGDERRRHPRQFLHHGPDRLPLPHPPGPSPAPPEAAAARDGRRATTARTAPGQTARAGPCSTGPARVVTVRGAGPCGTAGRRSPGVRPRGRGQWRKLPRPAPGMEGTGEGGWGDVGPVPGRIQATENRGGGGAGAGPGERPGWGRVPRCSPRCIIINYFM